MAWPSLRSKLCSARRGCASRVTSVDPLRASCKSTGPRAICSGLLLPALAWAVATFACFDAFLSRA
eukprot:339755-Alexandrium_andersonii.AAC.1